MTRPRALPPVLFGLSLLLGARPVAAGAHKPAPAVLPDAASAAAAPARSKLLGAERLEALRRELLGDDEAAALAAATQLGDSGTSNAVEPLTELLVVGAAPERSGAALDALAKLADVKAEAVLELYAGHRRPELRRRAIRALGAIAEPRVTELLLERLGDAVPEVRAAAAEVLAARKERRAIARLLLLVKRNDAGAAAPLGLLATPDLIPQLAELQGSVDDDVLATALGEYVKRADVADKLRVDVIRTIDNLPGASSTTALVEYLASVPAGDERPSKREAKKMLDARSNLR